MNQCESMIKSQLFLKFSLFWFYCFSKMCFWDWRTQFCCAWHWSTQKWESAGCYVIFSSLLGWSASSVGTASHRDFACNSTHWADVSSRKKSTEPCWWCCFRVVWCFWIKQRSTFGGRCWGRAVSFILRFSWLTLAWVLPFLEGIVACSREGFVSSFDDFNVYFLLFWELNLFKSQSVIYFLSAIPIIFDWLIVSES